MIDINTTGIALTRTSRLLRPQYCLLCPHAHRFAFVFLAWGFPQVTQTSATLTQARSTASSWQLLDVTRPTSSTSGPTMIVPTILFRSNSLLAPQTVRDCKDLQWQK
ncbi:hypothetical protein Tco_1293516 [Tanacetum coccineum]